MVVFIHASYTPHDLHSAIYSNINWAMEPIRANVDCSVALKKIVFEPYFSGRKLCILCGFTFYCTTHANGISPSLCRIFELGISLVYWESTVYTDLFIVFVVIWHDASELAESAARTTYYNCFALDIAFNWAKQCSKSSSGLRNRGMYIFRSTISTVIKLETNRMNLNFRKGEMVLQDETEKTAL